MSVNSVPSNPHAGTAPDLARSDVYAYLSQAFSFPDASLHARVQDGQLAEQLTAALSRLPYRFRTPDLQWSSPGLPAEMETEYIRLFQAGGRRGPPCSLHGGFYSRDRSRTLTHLLRFYSYFGLKPNECVMPDHICVELDFVSLLAGEDGLNRDSRLRAQRDFIKGQLAWTDALSRRVRASGPMPLFRSLAGLAARFVQADGSFLDTVVRSGVEHGWN